MVPTALVVDFTGVTTALGELGPLVVTAAGLVVAAGLTVTASFWGFPKLIGLFKKVAK